MIDISKKNYERHYWLDNTTFIFLFGDFTDDTGERFYICVEYWQDDDSWHFNKVYEDDTLSVDENDLSAESKQAIQEKMVSIMRKQG